MYHSHGQASIPQLNPPAAHGHILSVYLVRFGSELIYIRLELSCTGNADRSFKDPKKSSFINIKNKETSFTDLFFLQPIATFNDICERSHLLQVIGI